MLYFNGGTEDQDRESVTKPVTFAAAAAKEQHEKIDFQEGDRVLIKNIPVKDIKAMQHEHGGWNSLMKSVRSWHAFFF